MPTMEASSEFRIIEVPQFDQLEPDQQRQAIATYQGAFANPPYNELFTDSEARGNMQELLDLQGDLVLGELDGRVVSLAGGYQKPGGVYHIEELAVNPNVQGSGLGRLTLRGLIAAARRRDIQLLELKTSADPSNRAANLYRSEGFTLEPTSELVSQRRQHGGLEVDERISLFLPLSGEDTREKALKRVNVATVHGTTTAVICDQHLAIEPSVLNPMMSGAWARHHPDSPAIQAYGYLGFPRHTTYLARLTVDQNEHTPAVILNTVLMLSRGHDCSGHLELNDNDRPVYFKVEQGVATAHIPGGNSETVVSTYTGTVPVLSQKNFKL
ncbi:MAG TPA: GNAT family N-acetyltransferase [Candidatus Saccharimonadales bacterium]|nr:GNAT family N-acetyltransferase [Candidatus Saccharimonadales bacterium]